VVLVVGAGRVGRTIAHMLGAELSYIPRVCDVRPETAIAVAAEVPSLPGMVQAVPFKVADKQSIKEAMDGVQAVISAAPFTANQMIAESAHEMGLHYLDLTEDVAVTRFIKELSQRSDNRSAFVPQCGVAPGFITLAAVHVIEQFDEVQSLTLRVGALPDQPNNRLKYNLIWSTEGLVNEYNRPCETLREGKLVNVPALTGKEELIIGGVLYEAFNTSGGVGTLCHTFQDKIQTLDFKTIRYPGHLELIKFLMEDLRFNKHPEELVRILTRSIPVIHDGFVIVSIRALGKVKGKLMEKVYWRKLHGRSIGNQQFTGIEISTAAGVCGVLDLLLRGMLPQKGFVKMEQLDYDMFMSTSFGKYFARNERNH